MGEADDGVFALDVVVEEVEWLTGNMCFEPKRYFAQFHRQKVKIDAVDTVADRVTQDGAVGRQAAKVALRRCRPQLARWRCGGRQPAEYVL